MTIPHDPGRVRAKQWRRRGCRRHLAWLGVVFLLPRLAAAQGPPDSLRLLADTAPLFNAHGILQLTLEAPLRSTLRDRGQESQERAGTLSYSDTGGSAVRLDVQVRTRGKFRLRRDICQFPPLRLDFRRSQLSGTLFAGLDKLKLVTHCQDRRREYEQYVLQEYLVYRTYNLLTDVSFRVRLAQITYVDSEGDRDPITRYGFLIEDEDMLAARLGWEALSLPRVPPQQMDQDQLMLFEVFQYMIGNTDWSSFRPGEDSEACCHNAKLVGFPWGPVLPVPYDFDMAGVILTRYSVPSPIVGVRSVRERRYWGICRPQEELEAILPLFLERRNAIYALHRSQPDLDPKRLEDTLEYLDEFYETIGRARLVNRRMLRDCRRVEP